MTVMTLNVIQKQPTALRGLVCKYLAQPRNLITAGMKPLLLRRMDSGICIESGA